MLNRREEPLVGGDAVRRPFVGGIAQSECALLVRGHGPAMLVLDRLRSRTLAMRLKAHGRDRTGLQMRIARKDVEEVRELSTSRALVDSILVMAYSDKRVKLTRTQKTGSRARNLACVM